MSLEAVIAENTAAMKELTALLKGGAIAAPPAAEPEQAPAPAPKKDKPAKAEKPVEQPKAEEPAPEAPAPEPEAPAEEAPALTYDEVAKSVKAAAMRSRAKAMEILASFKIKHLSEAKPAQYPAIKAALDEIVAGAP